MPLVFAGGCRNGLVSGWQVLWHSKIADGGLWLSLPGEVLFADSVDRISMLLGYPRRGMVDLLMRISFSCWGSSRTNRLGRDCVRSLSTSGVFQDGLAIRHGILWSQGLLVNQTLISIIV